MIGKRTLVAVGFVCLALVVVSCGRQAVSGINAGQDLPEIKAFTVEPYFAAKTTLLKGWDGEQLTATPYQFKSGLKNVMAAENDLWKELAKPEYQRSKLRDKSFASVAKLLNGAASKVAKSKDIADGTLDKEWLQALAASFFVHRNTRWADGAKPTEKLDSTKKEIIIGSGHYRQDDRVLTPEQVFVEGPKQGNPFRLGRVVYSALCRDIMRAQGLRARVLLSQGVTWRPITGAELGIKVDVPVHGLVEIQFQSGQLGYASCELSRKAYEHFLEAEYPNDYPTRGYVDLLLPPTNAALARAFSMFTVTTEPFYVGTFKGHVDGVLFDTIREGGWKVVEVAGDKQTDLGAWPTVAEFSSEEAKAKRLMMDRTITNVFDWFESVYRP